MTLSHWVIKQRPPCDELQHMRGTQSETNGGFRKVSTRRLDTRTHRSLVVFSTPSCLPVVVEKPRFEIRPRGCVSYHPSVIRWWVYTRYLVVHTPPRFTRYQALGRCIQRVAGYVAPVPVERCSVSSGGIAARPRQQHYYAAVNGKPLAAC